MWMLRSITVAAMVAVTAPAWAQQGPVQADRDDPAKPQVLTFEMVLRHAVEIGGQNFTRRAEQMLPGMATLFTPGDPPLASGAAVHDRGLYFFHVQVPNIWLQARLVDVMLRNQGPMGPGGSQPVANGGRVTADAGRIEADPMGPAARVAATRPDFDAIYRVQIHDALVDAILDNGSGLALDPNDWLVVVANPTDLALSNYLDRVATRKLILQIRGSDLNDFRDKKINRDEAKRRIVETHF